MAPMALYVAGVFSAVSVVLRARALIGAELGPWHDRTMGNTRWAYAMGMSPKVIVTNLKQLTMVLTCSGKPFASFGSRGATEG